MKIVKNIRKNTIFILIITVIILCIVLKDNFNDIVLALQTIDLKYIAIAVVFLVLSIVVRGYANYKITDKPDKISIKEAIKHNFITQFFNGITPFSTGGQPMEIYMIREHNIPVAEATNITMQSFLFSQIALVICGFFAVIYNFFFHLFPKIKILQWLVLLGFIINIGIVIGLFIVSYSRRINKKISKLCTKLCKKFKINKTEEEIDQKFLDYYNGFQQIKKRKKLMVLAIILNIVSLVCLYIVPVFILYSMHDFTSMNMVEVVTASAYVYVIGGFVPIPGASGGIEYAFTQFFGNFMIESKLSALLLLWRTITYYFGMIVGALLFNFEKKVKK